MEIGAYDAKTRLSELLDRVESGEEVTITRHGRPVARLVPTAARGKRPVEEVIRDILEFRKGNRLAGLKIKEMAREGRS
jgi:prevent-host-death family protein